MVVIEEQKSLVETLTQKDLSEKRKLESAKSPLAFLLGETAYSTEQDCTKLLSVSTKLPEIDQAILENAFSRVFNLAPLAAAPNRTAAQNNFFSPASLLLFPVRTLRGAFVWCTTKRILEEFIKALAPTACLPRWNLLECPEPADGQAFVCPQNQCVARKHIILEQFSYFAVPTPVLPTISNWLTDQALPRTPEYTWWRKKLSQDLVMVSEGTFRTLLLSAALPGTDYKFSFPVNSVLYSVLDRALWEKKFESSHIVLKHSENSQSGIFALRLVRFPQKKRKKRPRAKSVATAGVAQSKSNESPAPAVGSQGVTQAAESK